MQFFSTKQTFSLSKAEHALKFIPAHDRSIWIRIGSALKTEFGQDAFATWLNWSAQDPSFNMTDAKSAWKSFRKGAVNIGTLIYQAKQHGWQLDTNHNKIHLPQRVDTLKNAVHHSQHEQEILSAQAQARKDAQRLFHNGVKPGPQHKYLHNKSIPGSLLKWIKQNKNNGALLIPIYDRDGLANIQQIYPNGSKRFLAGGKVKGCYSIIGQGDRTIYICEGWATGASIHLITDEHVICSLASFNLQPVAKLIRSKYPCARIIIAGDNDHLKHRNEGRMRAEEAARAINGELWLPPFPKGYNGSDWNDYLCMQKKLGGAK